VGTEWIVDPASAGLRLDRFLAASDRLGSRSRAATALDRGQVFLNDREAEAADAATLLRPGDRVRLWRDRPGSASRHTRGRSVSGIRIVFEDDTLIVVDKPAGVLTVPHPRHRDEPSVFDVLDEDYAARTRSSPLVVHRIDRDTSGLVVLARTPRAMRAMKEQFVRREPERAYLAVVTGVPRPPQGTWNDRFIWNAHHLRLEAARPGAHGVLDAVAHYAVRERLRGAALIEVWLVTGRRNQVRAQASLHGHPLAGERQYVGEGPAPLPFPRQALHAHRLAFVHPSSGERVEFESPLPADLQQFVERLRK
jgi:23S rRNA pseudouridine1911/1915/1917 synthase